MAIDAVSLEMLNEYLGKDIKDICPYGFTNKTENHCAHFVSHVLTLTFGYTCQKLGTGGESGRNVRVQEVFAQCPRVGKFDDPSRPATCLVFVTKPSNVNLAQKHISNVPKKHIGICCNGTIYHYSNTRDKVVTQTPAEFILHYRGQTNALFFGCFPADSKAVRFADVKSK
jgi:hypothetical protein